MLNKQVIISHLRMEGKYLLFPEQVPDNKHFHVLFQLDDGSTLVYQDVRKFGTMELLYLNQIEAYFQKKKLGPEPTKETFDLSEFTRKLKASKKIIKPYLLDQTLVVGLGNIYVDEALWAAKIHPERVSSSLTDSEIALLHDEIIQILQLGIVKGGTTIRTYHNAFGEDGNMQQFLQVYGKTGEPCPRCATPIEKNQSRRSWDTSLSCMSKTMTKIIGITGGIASGKSTVVAEIRKQGYQVIDADQVVHELQKKGGKLYQTLVEWLGHDILQENGELDRQKLGHAIFGNKEIMAKSSRLQNEIIRQELANRRNQLAQTEEVFFMDIPLLIELDYMDWFDEVWLVYVDEKTQLDRLVMRNHYTRSEAQQRIASQMSTEAKKLTLINY